MDDLEYLIRVLRLSVCLEKGLAMEQVKVVMRVFLEESQVAAQLTGNQDTQNYFVLTDFTFNEGLYFLDTNRLEIPRGKALP